MVKYPGKNKTKYVMSIIISKLSRFNKLINIYLGNIDYANNKERKMSD